VGFYIGKAYIEKRDIYTLLALGIIGLARYKRYPISYINYDEVLSLVVIFLLAKGLILPSHDSVVFLVFFLALLLTLFIPFFQTLLFLFLAFLFLRLFKVI
jgi:hypothetical protein